MEEIPAKLSWNDKKLLFQQKEEKTKQQVSLVVEDPKHSIIQVA